jgi:two-component system, sensor histidine kinase and response regulator
MLNTRVYLARLVNDEIRNCFLSSKLKNILMTHSIPDNLYVQADEQMVKTILRNLISNAVKFTRPGGNIFISAEEKDGYIEVMVKDTGKGIPADKLENLFSIDDCNFNTDKLPSERGKGLGLMLCKEFVEMHGGEIRVESIADKGSNFIFSLPMKEAKK